MSFECVRVANFDGSSDVESFRLPIFTNKKENTKRSKVLPLLNDKTLSSFKDDDYPPDFIKIRYKNDVEVFKIHEAILQKYDYIYKNSDKLKNKLALLEQNRSNSFLTIIQEQKITKQINDLMTEIHKIETKEELLTYERESFELLREYSLYATQLSANIKTFDVGEEIVENSEITEKRLHIIEQYLDIAKKYINLDVYKEVKIRENCPICGEKFTEDCPRTGNILCSCGYEETNLSKFSTFKDQNRVSKINKTGYEDKMTFINALDRFECRKIPKIPIKRICEIFDEYFEKKGFPCGEEIKKRSLLSNGKREGTSVQLILEALEMTFNQDYFPYYNYIGREYWGWVIPDLTSIRSLILYDYDLLQEVYEEIKERPSNPNIEIRMYIQYNARGCNFHQDDFKIVKTDSSLEYNRRMFQTMCEKTKIKYSPIG